MTRLEEAGIKLHRLFWFNTGHTADWPIRIEADDEVYNEFVDALNELGAAVEEVKPGSNPWPIASK